MHFIINFKTNFSTQISENSLSFLCFCLFVCVWWGVWCVCGVCGVCVYVFFYLLVFVAFSFVCLFLTSEPLVLLYTCRKNPNNLITSFYICKIFFNTVSHVDFSNIVFLNYCFANSSTKANLSVERPGFVQCQQCINVTFS